MNYRSDTMFFLDTNEKSITGRTSYLVKCLNEAQQRAFVNVCMLHFLQGTGDYLLKTMEHWK